MRTYAVIDAPSNLGLKPGVESAPATLRSLGLVQKLKAEDHGSVDPPSYSTKRDRRTHILNAPTLQSYTLCLERRVGDLLDQGKFPIVLGGDCSVLLGPALALKRRGDYGLIYTDGHGDFYLPQESPTGEAADMALGLVTGRGNDSLTNIMGARPYFADHRVILLANRDQKEVMADGASDVYSASRITVCDYPTTMRLGLTHAGNFVRKTIEDWEGAWLHLDVDVLSTAEMWAVDYINLPEGLSCKDAAELLKEILASPRIVGMDVTIYNPDLDSSDRACGKKIVNLLARTLAQ